METITYANKNFDDLCLHDLFIEQAKKTPDAIALVDYNSSYSAGKKGDDGTIELTYRQVDEITDALAVKLIEDYGVGPDAVVGILLPRCAQYVLAYVAILKAGGAYMPLELVYPKPLLERAVKETNAKLVLTNDTYANRIDDPSLVLALTEEAPFFVDVDGQQQQQQQQQQQERPSYPPPSYVAPKADSLAFCVMSSGTTGTPKGICQTHRAAVHSYLDRIARFPFHTNAETGATEDRAGAGVFFVWELMRPLLQGATTVVIPDHVLFDPDAVTKFVQDRAITRMLWTPSLLQLVLDSMPAEVAKERLSGLRYLWLCGEVVSRDLAVGFTSLLPHVELVNLYSISECHDVSIGDLKRELGPDAKYATCGKAIPGVKFYIVDLEQTDDHEASTKTGVMKLVPDGEKGEVYVGGPVVGRGYLNMPEKTADRFVDNPFLDLEGEDSSIHAPRLYRTGDLGRVLPDSKELEILGRCDFMVKIRGYSVVLGAIETALAKHHKLSSAVVLAVGGEGSRDKKLVAYVVPVSWEDPPSASSVRQFLKDHVPPYAIPSTFCVIDALPVAATAAGKLDRKKLPSHETAKRLRAFSVDDQDVVDADADGNASGNDKAKATTSQMLPENDTEKGILEIWSQLLDLTVEELSVVDSFFEVGGHSLLATKMVKMINERFSAELTIIAVMESPTIRAISNVLLHKGGDEANSAANSIDMQAEALSLDPSVYPFPTRKGNTMSRFRIESSALLKPRVVFLTGGTGYLGSHILSELLQIPGLTTICLARAQNDAAAKQRLIQTMEKYKLLKGTIQAIQSSDEEKKSDETVDLNVFEDILDSRLIAIAGDLSKPLLGMDDMQFKSLALEIDSIIHCGAEVNLIKSYSSLKESNVLGTQEVLRLATTNGFIKTKVKPVHYISTNGIFPVDAKAYFSDDELEKERTSIHLKEDVDLDKFSPFLSEGYAMTKWVAERMCAVAESRGLPVSVMRPGNMAGSSLTGVCNPDDFNYLLLQGILQAGCAPLVDTNYALDLTPVNFAAQSIAHLAVQSPHLVIGQRLHLQSPHKPVPLEKVVEWLNKERSTSTPIESVSRAEWMKRIDTTNEKLSSGWLSFEKYFEAYTWLELDSNNLQQALKGSSIECPDFDIALLEKWFPKSLA
mmetsp:Transcript_7172/g.15303  ORF Transcript_7172/g.15303 Transcript_7172/m.15303 type:complete len:1140 (+) Transcript_7172:145-3564(+)|eukprot:CAMPEP_0168298938 /NCGR_PEP_ID=MMETSP0142_2-20121227/24624_1 /TAXON_ID=44445 /ORGANISM="Pseudo-nitzschia australis, Strain 10249 10 AB" /LENGTH=1139 /DNA_ID=CAMNT_0008248465 /DNA_START=90 /DNA_END=3509 /DNA_ORIENTATION=-